MTHNTPPLVAIALGTAAALVLPSFVEAFTLMELMVYVIMAILALSLGFVWGYGGILCFGQAAFFGLGAYTYAVAVLNIGESTLPMLLAIAVPTLFAAALGYFMFYSRISDVYLGVITLTVTLILFNLFNSTSGDQYRIGKAPLGGFNGIPSIPTLNIPGLAERVLDPAALFGVCIAALTLVYVGLRWLLSSRFGRVVISIRENERRAELLGYDARLYKLATFAIGGGIAGLAGALYANWGAFTSPTVFSLAQSALVIIWVIVGGVSSLLGPIVGCFVVQWMTTAAGSVTWINPNLLLGSLLTLSVLAFPRGLVPLVQRLLLSAWASVQRRVRPAPASAPAAGSLSGASGDE